MEEPGDKAKPVRAVHHVLVAAQNKTLSEINLRLSFNTTSDTVVRARDITCFQLCYIFWIYF